MKSIWSYIVEFIDLNKEQIIVYVCVHRLYM